MEKIDKRRSIGEVARELEVETHVIRFWESKFPQIKPQVGKGSRRYYFDRDIEVLKKIKSLLHDEGYTISGLKKVLNRRKFLQKQSDLKEKNITDLVNKDIGHQFDIEDFIDPKIDVLENKNEKLNKLIETIEINLKKIEEIN